ncbi:MAG: DUF4405 domain-containing protein [Burkholderiales bacterium]|nr:DUF4405 domain-containing protein [Burkholderiales bacterium]
MRTQKHSLHHRPQFRLERWHRRTLYALLAGLLLSGLAWLQAHYFLRVAGEFGDTIHPLEHWAMQAHGALVMPFCFLLGSLLLQHMRRAHHARRNRASGWSMLGVLLSLVLTAYGLYYLASETSRPWWSLAHWSIGLALPLLLWLHIALGRRALC